MPGRSCVALTSGSNFVVRAASGVPLALCIAVTRALLKSPTTVAGSGAAATGTAPNTAAAMMRGRNNGISLASR